MPEVSEFQLTRIFNKLEEARADFELAFSDRHEGVANGNYVQGKRNLIELQKIVLDLKNSK